jgi:hypothetical protein
MSQNPQTLAEELKEIEKKVGSFSRYQTTIGPAQDIAFEKKPATRFLQTLQAKPENSRQGTTKWKKPDKEHFTADVKIKGFDDHSELIITAQRQKELYNSAKVYLNTAIITQNQYEKALGQIKPQSEAKDESENYWSNLALGIVHAQNIDLLVEQQIIKDEAISAPRTGKIEGGASSIVLLSSPALNFGYGPAMEASETLLYPSFYIENMYRNLFFAATQEGCEYITMPAAGLGVFKGDQTMYFTALKKVAKEFPQLKIIYHPAKFEKDFYRIMGHELPNNLVKANKDVVFIADELRKANKKCALHNPSDMDVVYGVNDVGQFWRNGRGEDFVGEEDLGAKTTAVLNSYGLNPNAYANIFAMNLERKAELEGKQGRNKAETDELEDLQFIANFEITKHELDLEASHQNQHEIEALKQFKQLKLKTGLSDLKLRYEKLNAAGIPIKLEENTSLTKEALEALDAIEENLKKPAQLYNLMSQLEKKLLPEPFKGKFAAYKSKLLEGIDENNIAQNIDTKIAEIKSVLVSLEKFNQLMQQLLGLGGQEVAGFDARAYEAHYIDEFFKTDSDKQPIMDEITEEIKYLRKFSTAMSKLQRIIKDEALFKPFKEKYEKYFIQPGDIGTTKSQELAALNLETELLIKLSSLLQILIEHESELPENFSHELIRNFMEKYDEKCSTPGKFKEKLDTAHELENETKLVSQFIKLIESINSQKMPSTEQYSAKKKHMAQVFSHDVSQCIADFQRELTVEQRQAVCNKLDTLIQFDDLIFRLGKLKTGQSDVVIDQYMSKCVGAFKDEPNPETQKQVLDNLNKVVSALESPNSNYQKTLSHIKRFDKEKRNFFSVNMGEKQKKIVTALNKMSIGERLKLAGVSENLPSQIIDETKPVTNDGQLKLDELKEALEWHRIAISRLFSCFSAASVIDFAQNNSATPEVKCAPLSRPRS